MDEERLKAMLELERRGELPAEFAGALAELRRRGEIPGGGAAMPPGLQEAVNEFTAQPYNSDPMGYLAGIGSGEIPALPRVDEDAMRRTMLEAEGRGTALDTGTMGLLNGMTFGLADEAVGVANAVKAGVTDGFSAMPDAYRDGRDNTRAVREIGAENNPGLGLASEVAGAVLSPIGGAVIPAIKAAPGVLGKILAGAGTGAAGAGLYGFNDSEDGFSARMDGLADAAPLGALVGGILPAAGALYRAGPGKWMANRKAAKVFADSAPDAAAVKGEAGDLYDALHASTARADPPEISLLQADLLTKFRKEGLMTKSGKFLRPYRDAKAVMDYLKDYSKTGMSADDMLAFRSMVSDMSTHTNKKIRRVMGGVKSKLDDFMSPKLGPDFDKAKDKYARAMRMDTLEGIEETARDKGASYYTQAGYEHALRLQYKNLLKRIRDGKAFGYSPDEIAAMQRIVDGGPMENALRRLGQMAPKNPATAGVTYAGPGILASMFGVPPSLIAAGAGVGYGAGRLAGHAAGKMQEKNAAILRGITGTGNLPPQIPANLAPGLLERLGLPASSPALQ